MMILKKGATKTMILKTDKKPNHIKYRISFPTKKKALTYMAFLPFFCIGILCISELARLLINAIIYIIR